MARSSYRPDVGKGGFLEQVERYPVTFGVLAANLVLFVFCLYRQGFGAGMEVDPQILWQLGANDTTLVAQQPWRLLTAAFLHGNLIHILFNSIALVILGRLLEVHYGSARLWVLYVGFCLAGSAASAGWHELVAGSALSYGASGGVFGLILLGYLYARSAPERLGTLAKSLERWILYSVVFSLFFEGIDHAAHIGGALAGAYAGFVIKPKPGTDPHPIWELLAHVAAVGCLACFALVVWSLKR